MILYAVHGGEHAGVYSSWHSAQANSHGISGTTVKKCKTLAEANRWVQYGPVDSDRFYSVPGAGVYTCWAQAQLVSAGRSVITRGFDTREEVDAYVRTWGLGTIHPNNPPPLYQPPNTQP